MLGRLWSTKIISKETKLRLEQINGKWKRTKANDKNENIYKEISKDYLPNITIQTRKNTFNNS